MKKFLMTLSAWLSAGPRAPSREAMPQEWLLYAQLAHPYQAGLLLALLHADAQRPRDRQHDPRH